MMWKNRFLRFGGILFFMMTVLLTGCGGTADDAKQAENSETGQEVQNSENNSAEEPYNNWKMPAFTTKDLDGNEVTEEIFAKKDLTVVNIWGTFCTPCIGEMPALGEWAESLPDNVQLIGLISDFEGEDDTEHHELASAILEKADADFLQIIANADFGPVMRWVVGVPTTLFVDKEGNIVGDPIVGADVEGYKQFVEDYFGE